LRRIELAEPTVVVGKVTRTHGVRGEVSVLVLSEVPERFEPGSVLRLEDDGRELRIESSRTDRGRLLVTFQGVADRDEAEKLRGRFLAVLESKLPELPAGSWWPHQLEGCEVVTESGRSLGTLAEVVANPANDLWVARDGDRETLVPALRDVIVDVDVRSKRVVVREIPGITAVDEA
jgi:16S rRNA processing protein RimM